jgi:hypothetical protein
VNATLCPNCHHRPSMRHGDTAYCYCYCHDVADAAPALLEACKAAVAATGGSGYWNGETKAFLELCEAAIAKAIPRGAVGGVRG